MSWTTERVEELTNLWNAGHSASAIGKHLGVTKNAVVGKAHRLKLTARPSPIRRDSDPQPKRRAPSRDGSCASASPVTASAVATAKSDPAKSDVVTSDVAKSGAAKSDRVARSPKLVAEKRAPAAASAPLRDAATRLAPKVVPPLRDVGGPAAERAMPGETAQATADVDGARDPGAAKADKPVRQVSLMRRRPRAANSSQVCQWPIGDPSDPDFHFCGDPSEQGKPYCTKHCTQAYIRKTRDNKAA